jgi:hypothetical protein
MRAYIYHNKGRFRLARSTAGLTTYREVDFEPSVVNMIIESQNLVDWFEERLSQIFHGGDNAWTET